jgi:hydroxymethylpyrimidine/phosphomethylpyrimidine kinase
VLTPNLPEARVLAGADDERGAEQLARAVHALGPGAVVVTGGHGERTRGHGDWIADVFFDGTQVIEIPGERYPGGASHGSGCTHSSALAVGLARGLAPLAAAERAREVAAAAVRDGLRDIGAGAGPVDVFALTAARRD